VSGSEQKYGPSPRDGAIRQGEILTDLTQAVVLVTSGESAPKFDPTIHPYCIVVSQDCDLDGDFRARQGMDDDSERQSKLLPSVLFCEVTTAEELRGGVKSSKAWDRIRSNQDLRYHFLELISPECDLSGHGLPELGLDFKRYFTIPTADVYAQLQSKVQRRCRLLSPYLEHFSTRFACYQFRVALPYPHETLPQAVTA
jgi:hypothetical protein